MRTLQRLSQAWCLWVSPASHCSRQSSSFSLAWFYQAASHSDFSEAFWEASQRWRDRLFSYFCWQRDCAEWRSQRKHRCISSLLAILLTASRQFSWLDVSVSMAATFPVVLGMYVGQHMRDRIAPETFRK